MGTAMKSQNCSVAVLAREYADLFAAMTIENEDAIDARLRAIRSAASHALPASADDVRFLLFCIEVESAFLRDGPVDDGERSASHESVMRMLAALAPQQETAQAA
jgi:hypothetical protein